tara:strand:+ start:407 stop:796 length:390 start_codon:yes stop_codon:yes gene_type:complete
MARLYFASGQGVDQLGITIDAASLDGSELIGVMPVTATTTEAIFKDTNDDVINNIRVVFTHDDTHAVESGASGHRCREIAEVLAAAASAGPHSVTVDVLDFDNNIKTPGLNFVTAVSIESGNFNMFWNQ